MPALKSLCRLLVRLHPRRVRRVYGREMVQFVDEEVTDARRRGGDRQARRVLIRSAWGLARSMIAFWVDTLAGRTTRAARPAAQGPRGGRQSDGVAGPMGGPLRGWAHDGWQAARSLRRSPGFLLLAATLLGVAVGTNTAIFATVHRTLLRSFPFPEPDRLTIVWGSNPVGGQTRDVISGSTFTDMRRDNQTFASLAAVHTSGLVLVDEGRPWVVEGLEVSIDAAAVLDVEPHLGRWFVRSEGLSTGEAAVMLGYDFWQSRFGGRPDVVGQRITTHRGPVTVVGVLPRDLVLPWPTDVVVPLHDDLLAAEEYTHYHYWLLGRLADGVDAPAADDDLDEIMRRIASENPALSGWEARVEAFQAAVTEPVRPALVALSWAVALLLLITAANLANLLLVRSSARQGELAVRVALGAGRHRLVRQLLLEGLALGLAGAVLGALVAAALVGVLPTLAPDTVTIGGSAASVRALRWGFGPDAVAFALALGAFAGVCVSLPSALRLPSEAGQTLRRASSRATDAAGRRRRDLLVVIEVALALVLLAMAGLSVRSTARLLAVDTGVLPAGVLTLLVGDLQDADAEERARFYREVLQEVERVPGLAMVGVNDYVPFLGEDDFQGLTIEGRPLPPPGRGIREEWRRVSAGYFDAAGVRVVQGRGFTRADEREGAPSVAVVNQAFVRRHFSGEEAVGRRIDIRHPAYRDTEIVGVVADVRARGVSQPAPPTFYSPFPRGPRPNMALFVRTEGDPAAWIEPVQSAIWRVDALAPVYDVTPLADLVARSIGVPRLVLTLVAGLGAIALLLSAIGVFGVIAYSVRMRRPELGVRMALGATPEGVRRMVLARALVLSGAGLAVGSVGAIVLGRTTAGLWYGVGGFDPLSLCAAFLVLLAAGLAASYAPASLAARTDPVRCLSVD